MANELNRVASCQVNAIPTSMRLTPRCLALMDALAEKMGLKRTGVVEIAVRLLAEKENINA